MPVNKVFFEGNLGQDPKIFAEGKVVSLSVANSYMRKTDGQADTKITTWATVKLFGYQARHAAKFNKGDTVFIEGKLTENNWDDKETGKKRSAIEIVADSIRRTIREERLDANPNVVAEGFTNEVPIPF